MVGRKNKIYKKLSNSNGIKNGGCMLTPKHTVAAGGDHQHGETERNRAGIHKITSV